MFNTSFILILGDDEQEISEQEESDSVSEEILKFKKQVRKNEMTFETPS